MDPAAAQVPCIASCLRMLDIRDVADDVKENILLTLYLDQSYPPLNEEIDLENRKPVLTKEDRSLLNEHAIQVGNGTIYELGR